MEHQLILAWHDWLHLVHLPFWNPVGATATAAALILVLGYVLKSVLDAE